MIQVYDRAGWLKSALIWLAGAIGVALIGYIVWRIQQSQTKELESADLLAVEFRSGKYVSVNQKGSVPFVALQAELRIHNRRDTPTSVYCDEIKVHVGENSEDFPPPELQPVGGGPIDMRLHVGVEANSTSRINMYSRKPYEAGITEVLASAKALGFSAVVKETFGSTAVVSGELTQEAAVSGEK